MDIHKNPGPTSNEIHSLDIIHLNTRSIRNKIDSLSNLVDSFHIACFSKTHLDTEIASNSLIFDGFDVPLRKDRTLNGGGIMLYISSMLKYCRRRDLENPLIEKLRVEVKFRDKFIIMLFI